MIRGWYTAASGMNAQQYRLDAISNNLANVDTTSYKRDVAVSKAFPELLIRRMRDDGEYLNPFGSADVAPIVGKVGLGVELNELYTVFEQGSFKETGNSTDIALTGEGFLVVKTPEGERFTRNGNFFIGVEGYLETKEGFPVMGEKGPLNLGNIPFTIDKDGRIFRNDEGREGEYIDRLAIVNFDNTRYLKKTGSSMYADTVVSGKPFSAEGAERPVVSQGFVESSNVNVVNEMVQMIEVNRAYEANQKTIQAGDTMLNKLWSEVVKV